MNEIDYGIIIATLAQPCVGLRSTHRFYKGDRCLLCGAWRRGRDPARRTERGRPKKVSALKASSRC
jgi:hypothetical protein